MHDILFFFFFHFQCLHQIITLFTTLSLWKGFPVAQMVKNLPAMWETWVSSLGREDSLWGGHGNPFQYSCLENPQGQRSLVGYSPWVHRVRHDWATNHTSYPCEKIMDRYESQNIRWKHGHFDSWLWRWAPKKGASYQSKYFPNCNRGDDRDR